MENHIPTVEELYQLEYKSRGSDVTLVLDLLDTSGSYPFPGKLYYFFHQLISFDCD